MIKKTFKFKVFATMINKTDLFTTATQAMNRAYAPYSKFFVGASILSESNKIYTGCNVENISYPCGTCAEQSAISAMISGGDRIIKEILIINNSLELITPCGACRQRIAEFSNSDTIVHLANTNGIQKSILISELLPLAFNNKELKQ